MTIYPATIAGWSAFWRRIRLASFGGGPTRAAVPAWRRKGYRPSPDDAHPGQMRPHALLQSGRIGDVPLFARSLRVCREPIHFDRQRRGDGLDARRAEVGAQRLLLLRRQP